jgi:hypothetical protein
MRRTAVALAFVISVVAIAVGSAGAATSKSSFAVFSDTTTTASSNGFTITTEFEGTFNVADKTASGEGEFAIASGGTPLEHGTFELTGLVAFQFYGCGYVDDINLGDDSLCGGRVLFTVHAITSTGEQGDGLLEVNCQIHGPNNLPPPGTSEGIKVNARGVNFNTHVTGDNVFVMLP